MFDVMKSINFIFLLWVHKHFLAVKSSLQKVYVILNQSKHSNFYSVIKYF